MSSYFVACKVDTAGETATAYHWSSVVYYEGPIAFPEDLIAFRKTVFQLVEATEKEDEVESICLTALTLLDVAVPENDNQSYVYWVAGYGEKDPDDPNEVAEIWEDFMSLPKPILTDDDLKEAEGIIAEMRGYSHILIQNIEFLIVLENAQEQ